MDHPHLRIHRLAAATVAVIVVLGLASCSASGSKALVGASTTSSSSTSSTVPDRPTALQPPLGFRVPDTRNVVLPGVIGKALPQQIPVRGGETVVSGSVVGPDGPVGGANVLIERFVGAASGSITVFTDAAGQFNVTSMLGGRYRARAWLQPSLATLTASTGFAADGDHLSFTIGVERHDAVTLAVAPAIAALTVGVEAAVNGLITQESVDGNGIIHTTPVAGASIMLVSASPLAIALPNPAVSGADGRVQWNVTCGAPGAVGVTASSTTPAIATTVNLPDCAPPPPTPPGPP